MLDIDEVLVLLAAAGISRDQNRILEVASDAGSLGFNEFSRLIKAGIRNNVFYPTFVSLRKLAADLSRVRSEELLKPYSGIFHQYEVANTLWLHESYRILELLSEASIDIMPLKGLHLAHCYYPSSMMRYALDIDLLFRSGRDRKEAEKLLMEDGFSVEYSAPLETNLKKRHSRFSVHCETHSSPGSLAYFFEFPRWLGLWARATRERLAGFEVYLPCPSDLLLISCVDMAWNGSFSARDLLDLRQIVTLSDAFDWEPVEKLAANKSWRYVLSIPLLLADYLCRIVLEEAIVPANILTNIARHITSDKISREGRNYTTPSSLQLPVMYGRIFRRTDFAGTALFSDSFLWTEDGEPGSWRRIVRVFLESAEIPTVVREGYGDRYAVSCAKSLLNGLTARLIR